MPIPGPELRSLIARIRAAHPQQVDIHFRTEHAPGYDQA